MRERGQWLFEVSPGERVTIRFAPVGQYVSIQNVGVWLDGNKVALDAGGAYTFTVSKPSDQSHVVLLECNFHTQAAADARYDISIAGSAGMLTFFRSVQNSDNHDVDIVFSVGKAVELATGNGGSRGGGTATTRAPAAAAPPGWKRAKPPQANGHPNGTRRRVLPPRERLVNVGFSRSETPGDPLDPGLPLTSGASYFFWLHIGPLLARSLEAESPVALPIEHLPQQARLKVVLFTFPGEIETRKGAEIGELQLEPDGAVSIVRQPVPSKLVAAARLDGRPGLFFPVSVPQRTGRLRLRCSIYHAQTLVQSRLIEAQVMRKPRSTKGALRSTVDYTLTKTIAPAHLAGMGSHRLSLMLNDNGDGNVGLRFFGEKEFKADATFDTSELSDLIGQARAGLRKAAWGDKDPWNDQKLYRYDGPPSFDRLARDLIMLAKAGYAFYDSVIDRFTQGTMSSKELAALMRPPGQVQIALKESPRHVLPAALVYDHPLDDGRDDDQYKICPTFKKAYEAGTPLSSTACFKGECPAYKDRVVVCPSGFWGYRHDLGMPLSLAKAPDAPTAITWTTPPSLTMAASTDLQFTAIHQQALDKLQAGFKWNYADTRDGAIALLKQSKPHLVYFYCHGGLANNRPYLRVGPRSGPRITRALFRSEEIQWDGPRPLVFINGCHTTALEPEQAIELVSGFVSVAGAAGVIGTEITVFEKLARPFAENFLASFVIQGKSAGESVRGARMALLQAGNPLGLAYIPFVMSSLRMIRQ